MQQATVIEVQYQSINKSTTLSLSGTHTYTISKKDIAVSEQISSWKTIRHKHVENILSLYYWS